MIGQGIVSKDLDMLKELAYISGLRGLDSSGIYQARLINGKVEKSLLDKSDDDISYYINKHDKDKTSQVFYGLMNNVFAGHVRAATRGTVTAENAHPFEKKNLVGMHNGTLWDFEYQHKDKTDSELMFEAMDEKGIKPVLENLLPRSAFAIVVIDKNNGHIHFARNSMRSLHFCYHAKRNVMYWASEEWMLRGVFKRNREEIKDNVVYWFKEDVIYTMDPNEIDIREEHNFVSTQNLEKKEWPQTNVVSFPQRTNVVKPEANERKDGGKIPTQTCLSCQNEMSLVEQYFAKTYSKNAIVCVSCDEALDYGYAYGGYGNFNYTH